MSFVIPAVLPKSERDFDETLARLVALPATRIQIDVVDGRFATPASWPFTAPKELRDRVARGVFLPDLHRLGYEIDLMCLDPLRAAAEWLELGATHLVFHAESTTTLPALLRSASEQFGHIVTFGLAVHVETHMALVEACLPHVSYVQCMGIASIGKQGQPFDERVLEKVRVLRLRHPNLPIQVDGGVSLEHARTLLSLGVTHVVVGSALVRSGDVETAFRRFEQLSHS